MSLMAERVFVSRNTMARVERGDPSVSMGIYATVLFVLGLSDRLTELAAAERDVVGLQLEAERLARRIRMPKSRGGGGGA
jgi:transcriptional regulator with XRE-family HTH domain